MFAFENFINFKNTQKCWKCFTLFKNTKKKAIYQKKFLNRSLLGLIHTRHFDAQYCDKKIL